MAKMMKATIRNGRATASGKVYNANHNTRAATRAIENHIDHERTQENINFQFTNDGRILRCGSFDAKAFELERYEHLYGEGQRAKNTFTEKSTKIPTKHSDKMTNCSADGFPLFYDV